MGTESLREVIEGAYDSAEEQAGGPPADTSKPVGAPTETPPAAATPEAPGAADEGAAPREDRGDGRARDGKFVGKKPAAAPDAGKPAAPGAAPAAPVDPAQQAVAHDKAPASWKPGAREKWASLSPEVREEVHRRERETAAVIQQSAQARQVAGAIQNLQQQFAPALQAEGVDVLTATQNLMQVSARLRFGTPQEKAMTVAQIMQAYGVDVMTLDAILSNSPIPQHAQVQQQQLRDPRLDGLLSQIAQARQAEAQRVEQEAVQGVEAFAEGKEFFSDVRETMADLMEVAAGRGIELSLDEAYKRACQLDPNVSAVLAQRAAAGAQQNGNPSTARNRAAASSVRSTPSVAGGDPAKPGNLRGAIEAAWDNAAGQ
jgi:hypothetical protein